MAAPILNLVRTHIIALAAICVALTGGVARAANTVGSTDIINGEVKSVDIGNGEVKAADIANAAVSAAKLAADAVTSPKIADGAIRAVDLQANTLTGAQINEATLFNDNSLTGADIDESTLSALPSTPSGPAGGDLAGTYPDPQIGDAAVTIPKLDFDPATQAELDQLATDDGDPPNAGSNLVNWSRLVGVPAGLADGTDDAGAAGWLLGGNVGTTGADFLGTTDNQPLNLRVNGARALRLEPASDGTNPSPNVIGGSPDNSVDGGVYSATIAGGGRADPSGPATANRVTDHEGTVSGGSDNQAGDGDGAVDDSADATVGGGAGNGATNVGATVAGGFNNTASGGGAAVAGGSSNVASGPAATVLGGSANDASGNFSLAGGLGARAQHSGAFVWADSAGFFFDSTAADQFSVRAIGGTRFVSGIDGSGSPTSGVELPAGTSALAALINGQPLDLRVNNARGLRIDPASDGTNQSPNVIGGVADNSVGAGAYGATIAGGARLAPSVPTTANEVTDDLGAVGGGANNQAGDGAGTVGDRTAATVGGGVSNTASGEAATVAGGVGNTASGSRATIGGGDGNFATALRATVGGGISNRATALRATVGGGIGNMATATDATVGGGTNNNATGAQATVPGGALSTAAGATSFAAGFGAQANHNGAFVWGDSQNATVASTKVNQFLARAQGGFFFENDSTVDDQSGFINTGTGAFLSNGGTWTNASDKNLKAGFESVDPEAVLERVASLPVRRWHYKAEPSVRHIGPVAQDFYRAFGVGPDNKHIASVDADGVALAAIQGLSRKLQAERRRRHEQERRLDRLEARLAALERR